MAIVPIVLGAASLAGSLLGKRPKAPKPQQLDISQELAQIGEMYKMARQQTETDAMRQQATGLRQTSESLAGRGIYRSPVSQQALGETRKSYATALSDALAQLSQQEIGQKAQLSAAAKQFNLGQQSQYDQAKYARQMANQAAWRTPLAAIGSNLLMSGLMPSTKAPSQFTPTGNPVNPTYMMRQSGNPIWQQLIYEPPMMAQDNTVPLGPLMRTFK